MLYGFLMWLLEPVFYIHGLLRQLPPTPYVGQSYLDVLEGVKFILLIVVTTFTYYKARQFIDRRVKKNYPEGRLNINGIYRGNVIV